MTGIVTAAPRAPTSSGTPESTWPIVAFFAFAGGMSALALAQSGALSSRLWMAALGSAAVGVGCFAIVKPVARREGGPRLARLAPATVVLYTFSFGILSLAWLAPQTGSAQVIDPEVVPSAVATAMIGLIALTVGYVAGPPRALIHGAQRVVARVFPGGPWSLRVPSIAIVLYVAGTAARAVRLGTGQYGYFQDAGLALSSPSSLTQLLSLFELLTTVAVVVAAIDCFVLGGSTRSRLILVGLATFEIAIALSSASKQGVLFTLVAIALVRAFSGRRLGTSAVIAAAVLVSLLFPFATDYRGTIRGSETGQVAVTGAVAELPTVARRTIESATARSLVIDGPSAVARRLREIDNLALVQQKTPEVIEFLPWHELIVGPIVGIVPRAMWPSKPIMSTGRDFAQEYYELPSSVYTASAVTVPGDLYRHGGIAPLIVGMALLGVILRFFESALSPSRDPRHLIVYVPLFLHLIKLESDATAFVVSLIQLLAFSAVTSWIVFTPLSRQP